MDMNNLYGSAMIQYILAKMKKWSYFQFGLGDLAELNTLHIISFRWVNLPKDNLIQLFLKSNRGGTQFLTNEKMVTTSNWVGGFGWILHSTFALLSLTLCTKEFLNSLIHLRVTEQTIFFFGLNEQMVTTWIWVGRFGWFFRSAHRLTETHKCIKGIYISVIPLIDTERARNFGIFWA